MVVRPAGSLIDASDEQPWKAQLPMVVRPAGSSIDASDEQRQKVYTFETM